MNIFRHQAMEYLLLRTIASITQHGSRKNHVHIAQYSEYILIHLMAVENTQEHHIGDAKCSWGDCKS